MIIFKAPLGAVKFVGVNQSHWMVILFVFAESTGRL